MNRSALVVILFAAVLATTPVVAQARKTTRPNILFAIADDWGWHHAGAYGDAVVKTPSFDRIAAHGVMFQHAFVSSPSCTPSRGAILTGRRGGGTCAASLDMKVIGSITTAVLPFFHGWRKR